MRKLRLDVDGLRVESFAPADADARRGTVQARGYTEEPGCTEFESCLWSCQTCYTYNYTCEAGPTCWVATCDWGGDCPQTFGVTCDACHTQGVIC